MLNSFDGCFQAYEKNWKLLPNASEDRVLYDKTAFYSERVRKLIGLGGIQEIHNVFKMGRDIKQVFHGNDPFKIGFDVIQHFAQIPKNTNVSRHTFKKILRNFPVIFCRGSYASENFGSDPFGFNPEYFPDAVGKKVEQYHDYVLYTLEDIDESSNHLKGYGKVALDYMFGKHI